NTQRYSFRSSTVAVSDVECSMAWNRNGSTSLGICLSNLNRVHDCCCSKPANATSIQTCIRRLAVPCLLTVCSLHNSCRISVCGSPLSANCSLLRGRCSAVAAVCRNSQCVGCRYLRDCSRKPKKQWEEVVLAKVLHSITHALTSS